ncbi:MAG: MBL fold metallo-hydrolase, partial [Rhodospirillaceae bacterium]|nr:MBL fold metallo-hydrolase [Rhodospirillaceae bacterium]
MTVKLYAMTCGWISTDFDLLFAGAPGKVRIPVPAYLIDHPKGRVLFDSGLHPDVQTDAAGRVGAEMAKTFEVEFRPGEEISTRLETLDIAAESIDYLVNSHLHWDHTGGNELIPNAKIIIQKKEWEAGHVPELIQQNVFLPADYNHGHQVQQIEGEYDLFGLMPVDQLVSGWRILFMIGVLPAILVVFIMRFIKEPDAWQEARKTADSNM